MLAWEIPCTASRADDDVDPDGRSPGCGAIAASFQTLLALPSSPMNSSSSDFSESNPAFSQKPSFELGDVPVVQERFQALIKERLASEIAKNPPLFPWESEVQDYADDPNAAIAPSPAGWGWLQQTKHLKLPVPANFPEAVLATLLQRCQEVVQTSIQDGAKLVRVVETLFPGQAEALNYLAGNVIMAEVRSPGEASTDPPIDYAAVTPDQQMVLSLFVTRELIHQLVLPISPTAPVLERQWLTDSGSLSLYVELGQAPVPHVRIHANLPTAGTLTLRHGDLQTVAHRNNPGRLGMELPDPSPNTIYSIEVQLAGIDRPLTFALRVHE